VNKTISSKQNMANIFRFLNSKDFRLKIFLEGIIVGLCVGVVISAFRFLLEKAERFREYSYLLAQEYGFFEIAIRFLTLAILAIVINQIMVRAPQISGSGIVQVKGSLLGQVKSKWLRNLVGKFVGTTLVIGAGLSVGRQGPSVQIGASIGQGVSRLLGRLRMEEKYLVTSGAAAGLAAAFNAPLAGVVFALEELHKNFSPAVLMSAMGSSLAADYVMRQFFGSKPIMDFSGIPVLPQKYYIYLIGLGIVCGLVGVFYNKALISSFRIFDKIRNKIPVFWKAGILFIPLFIAGVLGYLLPQVLGGGEQLIISLSSQNYAFKALVVFVVVKFIFTIISAGSGAPGGLFLPMLVIGALIGNIYGNVLGMLFDINSELIFDFVVFAMAAVFTAAVKAPVTGSILITEMTGSFEHLLPVIIVSMVAYVVSDILRTRSIYENIYQITLETASLNSHNSASLLKDNNKQADEIEQKTWEQLKQDTYNIDTAKQELTYKQIKYQEKDNIITTVRPDVNLGKNKGQKIGSKIILEEVVRLSSHIEGKRIKSIDWPEGSLLVSISRGEEEIIPRGNTRIFNGDFLYVLIDQGQEREFRSFISSLCQEND